MFSRNVLVGGLIVLYLLFLSGAYKIGFYEPLVVNPFESLGKAGQIESTGIATTFIR
jgi:hypothetical protein